MALPVLPAASTARTCRLYSPLARPSYVQVALQLVQAPTALAGSTVGAASASACSRARRRPVVPLALALVTAAAVDTPAPRQASCSAVYEAWSGTVCSTREVEDALQSDSWATCC